jgi:hypothetical protein
MRCSHTMIIRTFVHRRYEVSILYLAYIFNNNKAPETGEWVCGVGVGVRRGLRGASVPRWSA